MNSDLHKNHASTGGWFWRFGLRLGVGLALLFYVFTGATSLQRVVEIVRGADVALWLLALAVALFGEILTAWKWTLLVKFIGGHLPLRRAVRASFIGMFYNNFFPGSVGGDVVRVLMISREAGGKARAMASAFMQRNTGLAGLFMLGLPAVMLWPRQIVFPWVQDGEWIGLWLDLRFWIIAALAGYIGVNVLLFSSAVYAGTWRLLNRCFQGFSQPKHLDAAAAGSRAPHNGSFSPVKKIVLVLLEKLQRFHREVHGYTFWLPGPLIISFATQLVDICVVMLLSRALGYHLPFSILAVVVPAVTLANLLPVTVNGIGLREAVYTALLAGAGVPADQAVALSLMQFAVIVSMAMIGGIVQLIRPRQRRNSTSAIEQI